MREVNSGYIANRVHHGEEEKAETIQCGRGCEGRGAGADRQSAWRTSGPQPQEKAGETQAYARQAARGNGIGQAPLMKLIEGCSDRTVCIQQERTCAPRHGVATRPTHEHVASRRASRQTNRGPQVERRTAGCGASDSRGSAADRSGPYWTGDRYA